jgi:hypothetical protein
MRAARTCLCLLALPAFAVSPAGAAGDEPLVARKVEVSAGPLLLFTTSTRNAGDTLYVLDPQAGGRPQLLSPTAYTFGNFHRLGRQEILLSTFETVCRLDLSRGTVVPLMGGQFRLLAVDGLTFFLREPREEGAAGSRLFTFRPGRTPELMPLEETPFRRVLAITAEELWLIRGEPAALWTLSKDGKQRRKVFEFERGRAPTTHAFSPNRKLLAVALATETSGRDFQDLVVIHLATGREIYRLGKIPTEVSPISSHGSHLAFTWLDGERLRYSETKITARDGFLATGYFQWVDVNVLTGERLREKKYTEDLGLSHRRPPAEARAGPPKRLPLGLFDLEGDRLFYRGGSQPVAQTLKGVAGWRVWAARVAPGGRWAALHLYLGTHSRLYLVDGQAKRSYLVTQESVNSLTWLPAR